MAPIEADQWAMFRGDESRNAPSSGRPAAVERALAAATGRRSRQSRSSSASCGTTTSARTSSALPSMHPLAVADVVLMRTAFALQAVDFETGKLVWKYADRRRIAGTVSAGRRLAAARATDVQQLLRGLDQRMWEDATYGTLASDGERVYYVDDLGLAGADARTW